MGFLVTLLAVAIRLVWVWLVPTRPVGDFAMYVESARYLAEHGTLDPEFIYMPGYVLVLAAVDALGGGLVAMKMIGVASGALTTAAVFGTAKVVFGRGPALAAGLCCALWPAGIAVSSVTGTDMPAAALLATGVWLLTRQASGRPRAAAALYGLAMGLAAYVRAVALPLVGLSLLHFRARGARWRQAVALTAGATLIAFLALLPWGLRNRHLYGELTFTDLHGGHTALVGANPNSDGRYSRSLNRLFGEGTPYALFAPPHRESDRAAYALAKSWTRLEPAYAVGLLAAKAERLLGAERPLLYWPLYRVSVLPEGSPVLRFFSDHRAGVELLVDGFWFALVAAALIGIVAAAARRNWAALSLLPLPAALTVLYTAFFAEARYHLAIVALVIPFAGAGAVAVGAAVRDIIRWAILHGRRARRRSEPASARPAAADPASAGNLVPREAALALVAVTLILALVFAGWPRLVAAGARLRDRHRFAVCACRVAGAKHVCAFLPSDPPPREGGVSPVRGVWDGFGLQLVAPRVAATAGLDLPAGCYGISIRAETAGPAPPGPTTVAISTVRGDGEGPALVARAAWPPVGTPITLEGTTTHTGGKIHLEVAVASDGFVRRSDGQTALWLSMISVEREGPSCIIRR